MTSHSESDDPYAQSTDSTSISADAAPKTLAATSADSAQPDDDPGLPVSGIWLAVLLRGDTPLMRCGF